MQDLVKPIWNMILLLLSLLGNSLSLTFSPDVIEKYGDISWAKFRKIYKHIDPNFIGKLEEHYRVLKRDCFNSGKCKKTPETARNGPVRSINTWDGTGECPDAHAGDIWDYGTNEANDVTIDSRSVILDTSVSAGNIIITNGGKLIFRDHGPSGRVKIASGGKDCFLDNIYLSLTQHFEQNFDFEKSFSRIEKF